MYPGLKLVCLGIIGLSFTPHLCIRDAAQRGIILDSVQLRVAPNYYYLGLSATLCCAESYYLDSGGLLWIERDLALRLILSFGPWGIIMNSAQPCVAMNPIIWPLGDYSGLSATLRCAESFFI
ncbi:hypothetical protein B0H14DRAFT_299754 [Mycena olivaceomarginata]|nr:hypothetical protein B0H14DRAFT_299754 [Mycena olivaceomarginata]